MKSFQLFTIAFISIFRPQIPKEYLTLCKSLGTQPQGVSHVLNIQAWRNGKCTGLWNQEKINSNSSSAIY